MIRIGALLGMVSASAAACSQWSDWDTFEIHAYWQQNNKKSTAAKEWMKSKFCNEFGPFSSCATGGSSSSGIKIIEDFGVSVPKTDLLQTVAWFQQNRDQYVGSGKDLNIGVNPISGCPGNVDYNNYTLYVGDKVQFNTNSLTAAFNETVEEEPLASENLGYCYLKYGEVKEVAKTGVISCKPSGTNCTWKEGTDYTSTTGTYKTSTSKEDCCAQCGLSKECVVSVFVPPVAEPDHSWLYKCSKDCSDVCAKPYPFEGSTCSSESKGFHLHTYYVNNNPSSVDNKDNFHNAMKKAFNIPDKVCPDTGGHEMPHADSCWLVGPQGTETIYPQDSQTSSFVTGTHSLYVTTEDFNNFYPAIVYFRALYDIDFLFHPTFGCNYADHQRWSLHGGSHWANNKYGIAVSGDYPYLNPPSVDPQSPFFSEFNVDESCDDVSSYVITVFYNPHDTTSSGNAANFYNAATKTVGLKGTSDPTAYTKSTSPFTTSVYQLSVAHSDLVKLLPWFLQQRSSLNLNVMLSPVTDNGGKCAGSDYSFRSLFAGSKFSFNVDAFATPVAYPTPAPATNIPSGLKADNFILYLIYATNNKWQLTAANALADEIAFKFGLTRKECKSSYPNPEPAYGKLCLMEEEQQPYKNKKSPMTEGYIGLYIPSASLQEVFDFVVLRKTPLSAGYEVDTLLVPLTGTISSDYTTYSLFSGTNWRTNAAAFSQ